MLRDGKKEPQQAKLADRDTRLRLLAWSYLDAVEQGGGSTEESVSTGSASSRAPSRNHELWSLGSYRDMEKALSRVIGYDRLLFWAYYIRAKGPFNHRQAYHGVLGRVLALMPVELFVPAEVGRAAGFLNQETKKFCRCRVAGRKCSECAS